MKQSEVNRIIEVIDRHGIEEGLLGYSTFQDIDDEKFHKLRDQVLKQFDVLVEYLIEQGVENISL